MEILIIGGLLVALMAYVSTKIKREAKRAYEEEVFETDEFRVVKPEDFIIPVKDESEFAFEAYSKDFAEDTEEDLNQCWAIIHSKEGVAESEDVVETEREERGETVKSIRKTLTSKKLKRSFELEITVVPDYYDDYREKIEILIGSFRLV